MNALRLVMSKEFYLFVLSFTLDLCTCLTVSTLSFVMDGQSRDCKVLFSQVQWFSFCLLL